MLGDFVKGRDLSHLPLHWQQGIRLHRAIDVFTDEHPIVKQLRTQLGPLRRYGGIVLDIIFDHLLAKHFASFSAAESLGSFSQRVYLDIQQQQTPLPASFAPISERMMTYDWLSSYAHENILVRVLDRTSLRISRQPPLQQAMPWFSTNQQHIETQFFAFYRDLIHFAHTEIH